MANLSQQGGAVFQGGVTELMNIPQAVDNLFAPGDIVEMQLRLRFHVPGLEDSVRLLLRPALGDDLLAVRAPGPILRIRWVRNLGPIAVAAILVSIAIIVALLTLFVLFKISPETAGQLVGAIGGPLALLILGGLLIFIFTQQGRR